MAPAKESRRVLAEETRLLYIAQCIKIFVGNSMIFGPFFLPGIDEMAARDIFTVKTVRPGRILAPNLKLTGAFHQAVGHPALVGRVIIGERTGREVEGVAIRDPVAGIDFAAAGDKGEEHQKAKKPHICSIRQPN